MVKYYTDKKRNDPKENYSLDKESSEEKEKPLTGLEFIQFLRAQEFLDDNYIKLED